MSGRPAAKDIRPGNIALSIGNPEKLLPTGWSWTDLSFVANMATGHTPSRNHPEYWGGQIPWISVRDARPFHSKVISKTYETINLLGIQHSAAVLLPPGTVCLSRTGSIGYSIILGKEMATSQGFVNWICSEALLPRYLQLLFVAENTFLHTISEGVAHTTIYFPEAKAFHIALPPIKEQHRIVSKIEELFSSLDKGIESLKIAQQQLKVYRQAVLKWAFEGKLTKANVKDGELPEGWSIMKLEQIANVIGGVTKGRKLDGKTTIFLPYLRVANVQDGYLDLSEIKKIEALPSDLEKYKLLTGDILYTEGGDKDKLGRGTIWKEQIKDCIHQNHIFRARIKDNSLINPRFIAYFSQTRRAKDYFFSCAKQTVNLASINLTILSKLPIPVPPFQEQGTIVQEIESRLSVCDNTEETITASLQQAEALRQSILKKAFEGKLVPQDPNDEPASVLLTRIKENRERIDGGKRWTKIKKL